MGSRWRLNLKNENGKKKKCHEWMQRREQKRRENLQDNRTTHEAGNNQSIRHYKKVQFPKQALESQSIKQAEKGNGQSTRGSSSTQQHQQGDPPGVGPIQTHCSKYTHSSRLCILVNPTAERFSLLCTFSPQEKKKNHMLLVGSFLQAEDD